MNIDDDANSINNLYNMIQKSCGEDIDSNLMAICYLIKAIERVEFKLRRIADDIYSFKRFELNKTYSRENK